MFGYRCCWLVSFDSGLVSYHTSPVLEYTMYGVSVAFMTRERLPLPTKVQIGNAPTRVGRLCVPSSFIGCPRLISPCDSTLSPEASALGPKVRAFRGATRSFQYHGSLQSAHCSGRCRSTSKMLRYGHANKGTLDTATQTPARMILIRKLTGRGHDVHGLWTALE